MRKRHLDHMTVACLQILSQCRPTAIGSATIHRSNNSLRATSNWRQRFTTECKRSKSTWDVPAIGLPEQDLWCPSSKEQEATWLSLKCNYNLWYKIRWQRFSFLYWQPFLYLDLANVKMMQLNLLNPLSQFVNMFNWMSVRISRDVKWKRQRKPRKFTKTSQLVLSGRRGVGEAAGCQPMSGWRGKVWVWVWPDGRSSFCFGSPWLQVGAFFAFCRFSIFQLQAATCGL